jgi:hypothetical protein
MGTIGGGASELLSQATDDNVNLGETGKGREHVAALTHAVA